MVESIHNEVKRSLDSAEGLYYRLVLLVGKAGSGKTGILQALAEEFGSPVINVNLWLSRDLLELTAKQRSLQLQRIFDQIVDQAQSPVVLDNLEILFDRSLKQDPLRLLLQASRNRTVLASWNGTLNSGTLFYAETGHPEYRRYDAADALMVEIRDETLEAINPVGGQRLTVWQNATDRMETPNGLTAELAPKLPEDWP
jgi:hypothetical protein